MRQSSTSFSDNKHVSSAQADGRKLLIDEIGGKFWTDCLAQSVLVPGLTVASSYYAMIVSERCVSALRSEGVLEVVLPDIFETLTGAMPPTYLAVTGSPGVDLVAAKSRYSVPLPNLPGSRAEISTWTGKDFVCSTQEGGRGRAHFCSRRVLEAARAQRWTGFTFHPADLPQTLHGLWDGIDYLGEEWPPRSWYPPDPSRFECVEDWISAFSQAGYGAGGLAQVMVREHRDWSSQKAIDWLACYVTEHQPGSRQVDNAARVYWGMWSQHRDRFRFDPAAVEVARRIGLELDLMSLAKLRERYGK